MTWLGSPPFKLKVPGLYNYSRSPSSRSLQCRILTLLIPLEFHSTLSTIWLIFNQIYKVVNYRFNSDLNRGPLKAPLRGPLRAFWRFGSFGIFLKIRRSFRSWPVLPNKIRGFFCRQTRAHLIWMSELRDLTLNFRKRTPEGTPESTSKSIFSILLPISKYFLTNR